MNLQPVIRKLSSFLESYFESQGYDYKESYKLFKIYEDVNDTENYIDLYINTELSVDEFFDINESLNNIVIEADASSYFDIIESGTYMARIYDNQKQTVDSQLNNKIITNSNLTKFGEAVTSYLDDEYNEEFWVDSIDYNETYHKLQISVSSHSYVSTASIKIYPEDVKTYQEFVSMYCKPIVRILDAHIDTL